MTTTEPSSSIMPSSPNEEEEDIPSDVLEMKRELQEKTGKTYKYREPRQDLKTLLLIGAVQDQPQTWWEAVQLGLGLGLLFVVSFGLFYVLFFQYPSNQRTGKIDWTSQIPFLNKAPPTMAKPMHQEEF